MKKIGITRFLGTNCDRDVWNSVLASGLKPEWLWYEDHFSPQDYEAVVMPGGFSYGDYLRCGALAARSPVMNSVRELDRLGKPILGICNGFQILCESGLLPGVLLKNEKGRFVDKWVEVESSQPKGFWSAVFDKKLKKELPVAHGDGRFYADETTLKTLFDKEQVFCSYTDFNPNGSLRNIAGITNKVGNVAALMPHPERAFFDYHESQDGVSFFEVLK